MNASGYDDSDVGKKRNLKHLALMKNNAAQQDGRKDANNVDKIVGERLTPPGKRHKKKKKGKKKKETKDDNFTIDLNDPRFKAVYNDANYAIDPTDSKFQATDNMNLILKAKGQKR